MMYKFYEITPLRHDIDVNKSLLCLREHDLKHVELYLVIVSYTQSIEFPFIIRPLNYMQ